MAGMADLGSRLPGARQQTQPGGDPVSRAAGPDVAAAFRGISPDTAGSPGSR